METCAQKPEIPESALEHRIAFSYPWIDKWTIPNPFVALLYRSLEAWNVTLSDFAFRQDSKNIGDTALVIAVQKMRTSVSIGLDHLTFRSSNPDWAMAPDLVTLFDSARTAIEEFVATPVRSQECTLAIHVTPGSCDFAKETAKFVRAEIVGPAHFYGLSKHAEGASLLLEKSLKYEGGAFVRLTREFPASARFADIALQILADETAALDLIGVEDLV